MTNFFGAVGYASCFIQWLWVVILYSNLLMSFVSIIAPNQDNEVVKTTSAVANASPSVAVMFMGVVVTIAMIIFTIYILVKIPSTIVKASKKVVHGAAENAVPLVLKIQNKPDTEKRRKKLAPKLILIIKVILIILPVILSFLSKFIDNQTLEFNIAMYVSAGLVIISALFFVFQYSLAGLLSVKKQELW